MLDTTLDAAGTGRGADGSASRHGRIVGVVVVASMRGARYGTGRAAQKEDRVEIREAADISPRRIAVAITLATRGKR